MKHPEDRYTQELIEPAPRAPGAQKRGRGRPRKDNALSAADRARRYRRNQKEAKQFFSNMQGMSFELACRIAARLKAMNAPEWRAAQRYVDNYPAKPEPEASRKIGFSPAPGEVMLVSELFS